MLHLCHRISKALDESAEPMTIVRTRNSMRDICWKVDPACKGSVALCIDVFSATCVERVTRSVSTSEFEIPRVSQWSRAIHREPRRECSRCSARTNKQLRAKQESLRQLCMVEDLNDDEVMELCTLLNELNACEITAVLNPSKFVSCARLCEGSGFVGRNFGLVSRFASGTFIRQVRESGAAQLSCCRVRLTRRGQIFFLRPRTGRLAVWRP